MLIREYPANPVNPRSTLFWFWLRQLGHVDGTFWSPTMRPCETKLDSWEACHGPGCTEFTASLGCIGASLVFFVPPDYDTLVWELRLTNRGAAPVVLDLFPYVELSQLSWDSEASWGYYIKLMLRTWFEEQTESIAYLFHATNQRENDVPLVFLASTAAVASYSGDREHFIGDYRTERNPVSLERNHCGNSCIQCGHPAAALQNTVTVPAAAEVSVRYFLGAVPGVMRHFDAAVACHREMLTELRSPAVVERQKEKLRAWWDEHFAAMQCEIPDSAAKRHINIWNPINSVVTGRFSRSVNSWAPGIRGVGFRDTCQDMLAIAYRRPQWAATVMKFLMSQQFEDGHAAHTAYPDEGRPSTPSSVMHSDDHLWLPLLAHAIVAETGDYGLLEERVPYLCDSGDGEAGAATVWEHLMAAVTFTESHLGAHGLPLTLISDWNDIIGRFAKKGKGETVFAAQQYVYALRDLIAIAGAVHKTNDGEWLLDCLQRMETALKACAWDGKWWRRGFDDDGKPVGSVSCEAGNLFLNPQSWAVLSGVGTREQMVSGMDAVAATLDTGCGLKLLHPSFGSWEGETPTALRGYAPGCGENGAIFCHANTWAVIAEALLGRADRAWKYFLQLLPSNAFAKIGAERYRAEPYAWVSNIVGPDNSRFGWANVEQISGTAPWMDVAATQYLLGIRPVIAGLRIDPCIPVEWEKISVRRLYRGCMLHIEINNRRHVCNGTASIQADGKDVNLENGPILPASIIAGKDTMQVHVCLGDTP